MNPPFHLMKAVRRAGSKLGSLLLLFQKTPFVQMLLPEAKMLGTAGANEVVKWTVATIAGLGAFDTVAGATVISQVIPSPNATTVPATSGSGLTFVVQVTGAPSSKAGSWQVVGTLPAGLTHANATNSAADSISGTPTQTGSFPITIKAWEKSGYSGGSKSQNFTINVAAGAVTPPGITGQPASTTINSGATITLSVTASGTAPTFQWYLGNSGATANPITGATSSSYTTPALTSTASYWVKATNSAGSASSNTATVTVLPPPGFANWATQNNVAGGPDGDSDKDGIPNLIEYALQTNPSGSDAVPGNLIGRTVTFNKRPAAVTNGDVTYAIESSTGLTSAWTPVAPSVNNTATISYTFPMGPRTGFARIKVVTP